jgi:hypothetical protein
VGTHEAVQQLVSEALECQLSQSKKPPDEFVQCGHCVSDVSCGSAARCTRHQPKFDDNQIWARNQNRRAEADVKREEALNRREYVDVD